MIKSLSVELFLQAGTCLFLVYWSHSYSLVQLVYIILLVYLLNRKFVYYLTCQSVYLFSYSSTSLLVYHLHLLSHRLLVDGFEDFLHEFRRHAA